jgi:hypothetical protein
MPSALHKRIARIEELLATRDSTPVLTLWLTEGDDPEQLREDAVASGAVDPRDRDRIRFIRWLTAEEAAWQIPPGQMPGPPDSISPAISAGSGDINHVADVPSPALLEDFEAQSAYRERLRREEARILREKLADATAAFAKTLA